MKTLIVIMCLILSSCSSAYHLKKAYEKDPSLLKQDTLYIPTVSIDTFYQFDTVEIKSDLDSILDNINGIDSCPKDEIVKVVTKYITTSLITDTLYYDSYLTSDSLDLHLSLKIWQENGEIKFNSALLDSQILTKAPVVVETEKSWLDKKGEIMALLVMISLIFLIIKRR